MTVYVNPGDNIVWSTYYFNSSLIRNLDMNYNGIVKCWGNPNIYDGGEKGNRPMRSSVPYSIRYRKHIVGANTPAQWTVPSDLTINTSAQNPLANNVYAIGSRIRALTGYDGGYANAANVVVTPGMDIKASHVNTVSAIIDNLANILATYDRWFDSSGVCALSCQVQCQVGCQVTCQSCYGGQCHNKNCGTS